MYRYKDFTLDPTLDQYSIYEICIDEIDDDVYSFLTKFLKKYSDPLSTSYDVVNMTIDYAIDTILENVESDQNK